jgi:hypothetical protein
MISETPEVVALMKELGLPAAHVERARFYEFRPPERLGFAIMRDFLPGVEPYECTLTVDFFPGGGWVHMVVTQIPGMTRNSRRWPLRASRASSGTWTSHSKAEISSLWTSREILSMHRGGKGNKVRILVLPRSGVPT